MIERLVDVKDTNIMEIRNTSAKLKGDCCKKKVNVSPDSKEGIILSDLLKDFKTQKSNSVENDSGHDSDCGETDYKLLLKKMSSCDISPGNRQKNNHNSEQKKNYNDKIFNKMHGQEQVKNNMNNGAAHKNNEVITLQVKIKKHKSKSNSNNDTGDDGKTHQRSKKINIINNTLENLSDKLGDLSLSREKSTVVLTTEKQTIKINNEHKHKQDKADAKKSKEGHERKADKNEKILIIRGPIKCSLNDIRKKIPPYESQIHRNALSGGKVVIQVTPPEDDTIPSTVNKYSEINLDKITHEIRQKQAKYSSKLNDAKIHKDNMNVCDELNNIINHLRNEENKLSLDKSLPNDFYNWEEDLNMIMEILEGDQKAIKSASCNFSKERHNKQKEIEKFLIDETLPIWPNNKMNNTYPTINIHSIEQDDNERLTADNVSSPSYTDCSNVSSPYSDSTIPLTIQMSPYNHQDQNYLKTPNSYLTNGNLSPYSCSPLQGFQSPSIENVDNASYTENLLYESSNTSIPSVSRESHSSMSSSDSPNFQAQDTIFNFIDTSYMESSPYHQSIESSHFNNTSLIFDDILQIEKNQNIQNLHPNNKTNYNTLKCKYQNKIESAFNNTVKSLKKKLTPIASKEAHPCCLDHGNNAKQILEEMFNKLDDRTRQMICFKVHSIDDDKLMELFDGQLSSWNESLGNQFPRLPLLHATCERLLMRSKTMMKFCEVYINGHTILDRAVLTCSQSPLVVKYLTECVLRAMPHLPPNSDFMLDKADISGNTVLHRGAGRGEQCAFALSSLLSFNDLSQPPIFNVNRLNADGYTPLHIACSRHSAIQPGQSCSCVLTVHVLLEHGHADTNIKDGRSGNTPLHAAVDASICGPQLVSMLLKHGAKPSIRNYSGATALDLAKTACRSSTRPQFPKQVLEMLKKYK